MSPSGHALAKKRILIAEDDRWLRKFVTLRLEHEGYDVVAAADGEEVLHQATANGHIDLILLDVKMPKLNGFQVCKRLKRNPLTAVIPIIVFTASPSYVEELADRCVELGVSDWLKKPFRSAELLEKIRLALNKEESSHG